MHKKTVIVLLLLTFLTGCTSVIKQQRSSVVETAIKEIGTPYKSGGKSPKTGFDCSGLVYYSYKTNGFNVPRTTKALYNNTSSVWFSKKPGDLLFFNTEYHWWSIPSWFKVTHVGIYMGDGKMVHAPSTGGKVNIVNNVFENKYWKSRYKKTKRVI